MTNEWQEFLDYTSAHVYKADSKKDTTFLGRMLIDIFADFKGLERILTIIARGYLFHNPDGSLKEKAPSVTGADIRAKYEGLMDPEI